MGQEFLEIARKIEKNIKDGTYPDTLPSISVLSQMFNVCHSTVKRILGVLRDKDLVAGEHGRCVRVNPKAAGNPYFHKNVVILTDFFNISNPFYSRTIELLGKELQKQYISIHLFISENQVQECTFTPDCVIDINNSGQVILDSLLEKFPECKIIKLNHFSTRFPYIRTNNFNAGYLAMRHLSEDCGHMHIGILASQLQYSQASFHLRYEGAMEYARKHPLIKVSMVEVPELEFESQTSRKLMYRLMEKDPEITAVFASCDILALGVYGYAAEQGLKIPDDLAVIGFDNQGFGKSFTPPLSTFQENAADTAENLHFMTCSLLMGKEVEPGIFTEPNLIIRESTVKKSSVENQQREY